MAAWRLSIIASGTWGRPVSLREEVEALNAGPDFAGWMARLAARGLPPDWTEEDLRRQGHDLYATRPRVEQGHYDSDGHYRPGEDEEAVTPRAAWTAAQTL